MYLIGYILKPQGVKGEVKVEPVSPYPERYKRLDRVYIQSSGQVSSLTVKQVRVAERFVFLSFLEITTREQAERLRGAGLLIEQKDVLQPAPGEYFVHDLVGCRVISEEERYIGILSEVVQLPANDVYVVRDENGTEYLIPAVKEVVRQVDVLNKTIIIHLMDGLLE